MVFHKKIVSLSVTKRDYAMNEFKYNIGYALSGGFIKGFAHLGIMQVCTNMASGRKYFPE